MTKLRYTFYITLFFTCLFVYINLHSKMGCQLLFSDGVFPRAIYSKSGVNSQLKIMQVVVSVISCTALHIYTILSRINSETMTLNKEQKEHKCFLKPNEFKLVFFCCVYLEAVFI